MLAVLVVGSGLMYAAGRQGDLTAHTSAALGAAVPDFQFNDLDGKPLRLSDLCGKAVVVNFWATWCPPCREEIPAFIELQTEYATRDVQFVGISMDEASPEEVARFARDAGINYPVAMATPEAVRAFGGVRGLPITFYLGRDGTIVDHVFGVISPEEVERRIQRALARPAVTTYLELHWERLREPSLRR